MAEKHIIDFIKIADKIALKEELSDWEWKYFNTYISKMIHQKSEHWKEDIISNIVLKIVSKYDVTKTTRQKKNFINWQVVGYEQSNYRKTKEEYLLFNDTNTEDIEDNWEDVSWNFRRKFFIEKMKETLSENEFEIFDLTVLNNIPLKEVAEKLKISAQRVTMIRFALMEKLKLAVDYYLSADYL